jgi:hypothetical protein
MYGSATLGIEREVIALVSSPSASRAFCRAKAF